MDDKKIFIDIIRKAMVENKAGSEPNLSHLQKDNDEYTLEDMKRAWNRYKQEFLDFCKISE